jgi:hypothetical protein
MNDEKLILTLNQFLINPSGRHTAFLSSRESIIRDLQTRFFNLMKKTKNLVFKVYKNKDDYIFHFKIPSEKFINELFYDVVLLFTPPDEQTKVDRNITRYEMKFFSNSPAFIFTYAYVLNSNDLLVDILKDKINKKALTEEPSQRNPVETLGFEKSCYFAGLYIKENNLLNKFQLDNNLFLFKEDDFKKKIKSDEKKLQEYNELKKEKIKEKSKVKKQMKKAVNPTVKKISTRKK